MRYGLTSLLLILVGSTLCAAPRVVVFDSPAGMTAQALQKLGVSCTVAPPGDYGTSRLSLFDYQIAVWGMDVDQARLNASPQPLHGFLQAGGVFLAMRCQQECTWPPSPLKMDKAYELGQVLKPDHPLFSKPNAFTKDALSKVHAGSVYKAFYALGEGWVPLVSTGREQHWDKTPAVSTDPHYGLLELAHGKGRVILCQMIPDYAFISDDKGQPGPGSRFLENLVAYATAFAPNWPAPKPRLVPASYHTDLSYLLRDSGARGTLPMADKAWQITSQGAYTCKPDRRGVMTVSAADRPAVAGSFLQLERAVKVAPGRVFLRFYNSDDYCGGMDPHMVGDARVSQRENRVKDTRFKQVLVNGQVVWEQDVLGLNERPASRRFHTVDISQAISRSVTAPTGAAATGTASAFALALRVEDRKPTADDEPFATDVYWAGVDVLPGIVQVPVDEKQTTVKTVFSGPKGRHSVVVRALDEHTGRGTLTATVDGKPLGKEQLTADDYGWYWINLGLADLKPGSVVVIKATPEGGETCRMQSLALVPLTVRQRPPETLTTREQEFFRAAVSSSLVESPLYKRGPAVPRATFPVVVSGPEAYKPHGEVVSSGMPFAYGAVKSERNIRLLNDQDKEVPLQTRVLAKWPDGSLKWVLFSFPTGPGALRCEYGSQVRRAPVKGMTVTQTDRAVSIDTGPLQATLLKRGWLFETITVGGKKLPSAHMMDLRVKTEGDEYDIANDQNCRVQIVEAGPLRTVIRRVGRLQTMAFDRLQTGTPESLLEYDLTLEFAANSGTMRVQSALTHKEASAEEKLLSAAFSVISPWAKTQASQTVWLGPEQGATAWTGCREASLTQADDQQWQGNIVALDGKSTDLTGKRQLGYMRLTGPGASIDIIPRWFWQMYPAGLRAYHEALNLMLVSKPLTIYQGQALWNDFALRFSDDTGQPNSEDFAALANPAVAFAEPTYTAATLALGQFMPEDKTVFPEYEASVESRYRGYLSKREARREYGLQNFGDDTFEWGYGPSYTFWSNQEYDHHYGMLVQFARSGDWRWWEIGDQGARHNRDVDCYHWAPGREHLLGAPHHHNSKHIVEKGWVPDHTVSGAHVSHAWIEGLIAHYFLTGDQRTLETWQGMADWFAWCANNNQYGAGGQERGPGWTLVALAAAYNATGERKYLEAGNKVMEWLWDIQDPVRGVISVPVSEQPSYEGGSSFMHGIVARGAGRWYEATGDFCGKFAALGIADWLTSEAMGSPATFYYKQAPRVKGGYGSDWQCLTAMTYGLKYGDQAWYGPLAETLYNAGRPDTRSMAWVPQSLAHLQERFWPYRGKWSAPQAVASPDAPADLKLQLVNASDAPVKVLMQVKSAPAGVTVTLPSAPVSLPAKGVSEVTLTVAVKQLATASGKLQLGMLCDGQSRLLELPVVAVPVLVKVGKSAAEGQLQPPFVLDKDKSATAPRDASFTGNPRQPGERAGWVAWEIEVPVEGSYLLTADCWWLDDKGNSLYLQIDDGPEVAFGNDGDMGRWHQVPAPEPLRLSAGKHTLRLLNREDGAKVRSLLLTNGQ